MLGCTLLRNVNVVYLFACCSSHLFLPSILAVVPSVLAVVSSSNVLSLFPSPELPESTRFHHTVPCLAHERVFRCPQLHGRSSTRVGGLQPATATGQRLHGPDENLHRPHVRVVELHRNRIATADPDGGGLCRGGRGLFLHQNPLPHVGSTLVQTSAARDVVRGVVDVLDGFFWHFHGDERVDHQQKVRVNVFEQKDSF